MFLELLWQVFAGISFALKCYVISEIGDGERREHANRRPLPCFSASTLSRRIIPSYANSSLTAPVTSSPRSPLFYLLHECKRPRFSRVHAPTAVLRCLCRHSARAGPEAVAAMSGQQQQIVDTIFNMKRRMLRRDDCNSDPRPAGA